MKLTALSVDGFKNLKGVSLIPDPSYNLILGENAQGKTNLLEAIWTLTGCRSFRGTRERDYLPFSGGNLQVEAKFQDARREQSVRLCMVSGICRKHCRTTGGPAENRDCGFLRHRRHRGI